MPKRQQKLSKNVYLIGFMGAGKSTVARRIARVCGVTSLDVDKYIERSQEKTISEIFEAGGEELFRSIETDTMRQLAGSEDAKIFSCGGGAPMREENRRIMADSGIVILLDVTADEAARRISDKSSRPLFNDIEAARDLCESRRPTYMDVADHVVRTEGMSVPAIADEVMEYLRRSGVLT